MNKQEILTQALNQRHQEILEYQINIDNYTLAIEKINKEHIGESPIDEAMMEFKAQLEGLLQSSLIEQRKAMIIRDVIQDQLGVENVHFSN